MNDKEIVLGLTKGDKILIFLLFIVLGGLLGWFIPVISNWLLKLPVVPLEVIIEFVASLNSFWVSIVAAIIGIIIGIFLTFTIFDETLEVTITSETIQLKLGDMIDIFDKKNISAIYMENKQLVILAKNSQELYRETFDLKIQTVRDAFKQYEYPWYDNDPYENQYQRWVLGHPDFPEKINALLYAREQSVRKGKKEDAKVLQKDLAKLGVVIRDEKNAQYVRLVK